GYGLIGMRERIELVAGSLLIESEPGSGTTLTVTIPLRPAVAGQTP
ncbi:MAG: Histidine kinase, gyrase and HSP90-like ATPase, partial [Gaiellales bacterium]|nr:Histidine kinase, gyrase and HSP90-like ATPase [Gaiellales bacterium]